MESSYLDEVSNIVTRYSSTIYDTISQLESLESQNYSVPSELIEVEQSVDLIENNENLPVVNQLPIAQPQTEVQQLSISDSIFSDPISDSSTSSSERDQNNYLGNDHQQSETDILAIFGSNSEASIRDAVKTLSYSLLSGEFLKIKDFERKIHQLIQQIQQLITQDDDSSGVTSELLKFTTSLIYCLDEYRRFLQYLFINFSKDRSEEYFQIEDESIDTIQDHPDGLQNVIRLFILALKVSRKDLLINSDPSELRNLAILSYQVDKLKNVQQSVARALEVKLEFLIHKWDQRYKKKSPESSLKYRIGDIEKSLNGFNQDIPTIKDWNKKIYYHYDFCKESNKYRQYIQNTLTKKTKGYSKLSFFELHGLVKYYKDFSKSETELKAIVDHLLNTDYSDYHTYDQYCVEIIRNYGINNYFSLISDNKSLALEKYQEIYLDCKSKLNHLSNNYFLQMKYLNYVLDRIDEEYAKASKEDLITINEKYHKKVSEECTQILDEYYVKKEWAKVHDNYIVILPYEESLVDLSNIDKDLPPVLFFTSFVLPDYKDSIDFDYSKTRQKYREVKSLTNVVHSLKGDLKKLETLNNDFERKDLKSIEIISLFTAVITFVLSSIPAFKFVETVQQASLFMLSMAASLGIFILLIFSFTRGFSDFFSKQRNWIVFIVIIFLFIVTAFSLISFENKSVNGIIKKSIENEIEKSKLDSLKNNLRLPVK